MHNNDIGEIKDNNVYINEYFVHNGGELAIQSNCNPMVPVVVTSWYVDNVYIMIKITGPTRFFTVFDFCISKYYKTNNPLARCTVKISAFYNNAEIVTNSKSTQDIHCYKDSSNNEYICIKTGSGLITGYLTCTDIYAQLPQFEVILSKSLPTGLTELTT